MYALKTILPLAFLLVCIILVSAQDKAGDDRRMVPTPEAQEKARRQLETLRRGDFARLKVTVTSAPGSEKQGPNVRLKLGERAYLRVEVTNLSSELVILSITDPQADCRPQLFKDGQPVPYRDSVNALLERKDKDPVFFSSSLKRLNPGESWAEAVNLSYWYERLEPGRYEVSVKHRFARDGEWVESPKTEFEVRAN